VLVSRLKQYLLGLRVFRYFIKSREIMEVVIELMFGIVQKSSEKNDFSMFLIFLEMVSYHVEASASSDGFLHSD